MKVAKFVPCSIFLLCFNLQGKQGHPLQCCSTDPTRKGHVDFTLGCHPFTCFKGEQVKKLATSKEPLMGRETSHGLRVRDYSPNLGRKQEAEEQFTVP